MEKMKKIICFVLFIGLLTSANAVSFSWLSSKLSGDGTIKSISSEVQTHGWDFRSYTYIDPAGRICTIVFTDEKGGSLDCDFPPEGFDYSILEKEQSNKVS